MQTRNRGRIRGEQKMNYPYWFYFGIIISIFGLITAIHYFFTVFAALGFLQMSIGFLMIQKELHQSELRGFYAKR